MYCFTIPLHSFSFSFVTHTFKKNPKDILCRYIFFLENRVDASLQKKVPFIQVNCSEAWIAFLQNQVQTASLNTKKEYYRTFCCQTFVHTLNMIDGTILITKQVVIIYTSHQCRKTTLYMQPITCQAFPGGGGGGGDGTPTDGPEKHASTCTY